MIGFGNSGGIIATFTFLTTDAPYYRTGYSICMGAACIRGAASILYGLLILKENRSSRKTNGETVSQHYSM
jgi:hypothetical protein